MATKHDVTENAARSAHSAIDQAAQRVAQAEETLREKTSEADEALRQSAQTAQQYSQDMYGNVREYVNEHPLASMAIAFGLGAAVSALMRRR